MIKYYAYYSYGGFKDMLVGSQADSATCNYYLPLVEAEIDVDPEKQGLPKIRIIGGEGETEKMPRGLSRIVYNGGYRVFFSRNFNGKSVLIVRDVMGSEKDESGRSIPFVLELVGDLSDGRQLASAAACLLQDETVADMAFGPLFHYEPLYNGLCFECKKMTDWLAGIADVVPPFMTRGGKTVDLMSGARNGILSTTMQGRATELISKLGLENANISVIDAPQIEPRSIEDLERKDTKSADADKVVQKDQKENPDQVEEKTTDKKEEIKTEKAKQKEAAVTKKVEIDSFAEESEIKKRNVMTYAIIGGGVIALCIAAAWLWFLKD